MLHKRIKRLLATDQRSHGKLRNTVATLVQLYYALVHEHEPGLKAAICIINCCNEVHININCCSEVFRSCGEGIKP